MKIKSIEFENFRNFKGKNKIEFDTNKRVTIIYGKNGDGKTTLHQLFQWIFYNKTKFNKTASDIMYNHEYESEVEYDQVFPVKGTIDFENNNEMYSLNREWTYQKGLDQSKLIKQDITLYKMIDDNWDKLHDPEAVIEELLPSGLSEYFFFDGESMIADLKVKGKESANKLKEALYTIFDLSIYEQALSHIGNSELKTTVLGQLYLNKASISDDEGVAVAKTNINNAHNKIEVLTNRREAYQKDNNEKNEFIQSVSEKIGGAKSTAEYESDRKQLIKQRDVFLKNEKDSYARFGDAVAGTFPRMMVSKRIEEAKKVIKLKADKNTLIPGVNKVLIDALKKESYCLCGNEINNDEIQLLNDYLKLLPPLSYQQTYDSFSREASRWGSKYDRDTIEEYIQDVLDNREQATTCDKKIQALDKKAKENEDVQQLIIDRKKAEEKIKENNDKLSEIDEELTKLGIYLKQQMKKFDDLTEKSDTNKDITKKMKIMEEVKQYFSTELFNKSKRFSTRLEEEIQYLLEQMLTSRRHVSVSNDFFVQVKDSYGDEAKSEGQFAVVSFAYIGGVLKLLKDELKESVKEYPLILDGPFSKLDEDQKKNVINTVPKYAPQLILFSKDSLEGMFSEDVVDRPWTIESNDEKNVASVKEGYLW